MHSRSGIVNEAHNIQSKEPFPMTVYDMIQDLDNILPKFKGSYEYNNIPEECLNGILLHVVHKGRYI